MGTEVLILGVTGMLGSAVFKMLLQDKSLTVYGTLRSVSGSGHFPVDSHTQLLVNVDVLDNDSLIAVMTEVKPDLVINCIGLIKQCHVSASFSKVVFVDQCPLDSY